MSPIGAVKRERIVGMLVVFSLAFSGLAALPFSHVSAEYEPDPLPSGDWTVTLPCGDPRSTIDGYVHQQDGDLTIASGGCLTVRDGGLSFVQDSNNIYTFTVNAGGTLILDNSTLTTWLDQIFDYPKLEFLMNGEFYANYSLLRFPGRFNSTGGTIFMQGTTITGYETLEIDPFISLPVGDNDDGPIMRFTNSVINLFDARIERLYEYDGLNPSWQEITLNGNTQFTAVNTFIGVDYDNDTIAHNVIRAADTADAFLYNVTIQEPYPAPQNRIPAFVPENEGQFTFYRWLEAQVKDARGVPVPGANVDSWNVGLGAYASYPDNGGSTIPPDTILQYLGKTPGNFNTTGLDGKALIPLRSEWINEAVFDPTTPNSQFEGNYLVTAEYLLTNFTSGSMSFDPYPALQFQNNTRTLVLSYSDLFLPLPDLVPVDIQFSDPAPFEGDNITINATVSNTGAGGATDILVEFWDVGPLTTELINTTVISFIAGGGSVVTPNIRWDELVGGNHSVKVVVDPLDTVFELNEGNNIYAEFIEVAFNIPDLVVDTGDISFQCTSCPADSGFVGNPVTIRATVRNEGRANGTNVNVEFYIGDPTAGAGVFIGDDIIANIPAGGAGVASIGHVFTATGSETVYVWVDPADLIPESNETNNVASRNINILPVSNLAVKNQDLWVLDPCGNVGDPIVPRVVVSNVGLVSSGAFSVSFYIDGVLLAVESVPGLTAGYRAVVTSSFAWTPATTGYYTVTALVDSGNAVVEGDEGDNSASAQFPVFSSTPLQISGFLNLTDDTQVTQSLEILGDVTLTNMDLSVAHADPLDGKGLYYVKVMDGGSLTLNDATISSRNGPLTVCAVGSGQITVNGGGLTLDDTFHGDGLLFSGDASRLDVNGAVIRGDIRATGLDAVFNGVTALGDLLYIHTTEMSSLWDVDLTGVAALGLTSDDGDVNTLDFDIRNVTFNSGLDAQLTFGGDQWAALTGGATFIPLGEDWWTGMIAANAKVSRHWWLTVWAVDGTDSLLDGGEASVNVTRQNYDFTLFTDPLFPLNLPTGELIYRVIEQDRYADPDAAWSNSTYLVDGFAVVGIQMFWPDANWSGVVTSDTLAILKFSGLTPDFYVNSISFAGENPLDPTSSQPVDRQLTISAEVCNSGNIDTSGVDIDYFVGGTPVGTTQVAIGAAACTDANLTWTPAALGSFNVLVVIDQNNLVRERDESNNTGVGLLQVVAWPNLDVLPADVTFVPTPAHGAPTTVRVVVRNLGRGSGSDIQVTITDNRTDTIPSTSIASIPPGGNGLATTSWTPGSDGPHRLTVCVDTPPGIITNTDYDQTSNCADRLVTVLGRPDLTVALITLPAEITQNLAFNVQVRVANIGGSIAENFSVALYDGTRAPTDLLGRTDGVTVDSGDNVTVTVASRAITDLVPHTLLVWVDDNETINEADENNNDATQVFTAVPPPGFISLLSPAQGAVFTYQGSPFDVLGTITTNLGNPIVNATIRVEILFEGNIVRNPTVQSNENGAFTVQISPDFSEGPGNYTLRVTTTTPAIEDREIWFLVEERVEWWELDFLGLPLWIWLIIIIIIIAVVVGVTAYVYVFGLGKLVECGECGAFIPEASTSCPKCGVEFETDTAKCSNCGAWIPVDVKSCPECGVEFATGEIEMEDYRQKMRMQYDEVVQKFRGEAEAELGHTVSNEEFNAWWRSQPTFLTFEDWLREEEEMRKMGSRSCPHCGTLNSVTATICHKCGGLLEVAPAPAAPPPAKPAEAVPPKAEAPAEPGVAPPEGAPARVVVPKPVEPVPKKVVKKPVTPVPKKVVRRVEEEETDETEGE